MRMQLTSKVFLYLVVICLVTTIFSQIFLQKVVAFNSPDKLITALSSNPILQKQTIKNYQDLGLSFEINQGQVSKEVKYFLRGNDYVLFLTSHEVVFSSLQDQKSNGDDCFDLSMHFVGLNPSACLLGEEQFPGVRNYFVGNKSDQWQKNVPTYRKVRHKDLYPGIDLVYYGNQGQFEYDFIVAPGRNPKAIKIKFEGAKNIQIDNQGNLLLSINGMVFKHCVPKVYQQTNGTKQFISGSYVLNEKKEIGFTISKYDSTKPLIIDPVIAYSTYLGGSDNDKSYSVTVDAEGNSYVTGTTSSINFHSKGNSSTNTGLQDVFVSKISADGTTLLYSTYIGGSDVDQGTSITLDRANGLCLTGITYSSNFPIQNALQLSNNGKSDAFITKLNTFDGNLVYSTYLGGNSIDQGNSIATDQFGNIYITGSTSSNDFPTNASIQTTFGGMYDVFVVKINSGNVPASQLIYSTYLGGNSIDVGYAIAVDLSSNIYVAGSTNSTNLPLVNPTQSNFGGGGSFYGDLFLAKIDAANVLAISTYFGGQGEDCAFDIEVKADGIAYVTGVTRSVNFPVTSDSFQSNLHGESDAFVVKWNTNNLPQNQIVYSTYLGGSSEDQGHGVAVSESGTIFIVGKTTSINFPLFNPLQNFNAGNADTFVAELDSTGSSLIFSTYLGGNSSDSGESIAIDSIGNAYISGVTQSTDFPHLNALQLVNNGGQDVFAIKIGMCPEISLSPSSLPTAYVGVAYNQIFTAETNSTSYRFSVNSGELPVGLVLSSNGVLNGMPTTKGEFVFTIKAVNSVGCSVSKNYSLTVLSSVVESANFYVADTINHRIQKFDGVSWTILGSGGSSSGQFYFPEAVIASRDGMRLYVADTGNNRVQWSLDGGVTWADFVGAGSGLSQVSFPRDVILDRDGNLYVADAGNNQVLRFANGLPNNPTVLATAGSEDGKVINPSGLAIDSSFNLYIADTGNSRVLKIPNANLVQSTNIGIIVVGSGSELFPVGQVSVPEGVAVDEIGNLYIADTGNNRVILMQGNLNGGVLAGGVSATQICLAGSMLGYVQRPKGIAVSNAFIVVSDTANDRVQSKNLLTGEWKIIGTPGSSGPGQMIGPSKVH